MGNKITTLPPPLRGTTEKKIAALQQYLTRMAMNINSAVNSLPEATAALIQQEGQTGSGNSKEIKDLQAKADSLKSLIVKTAKEVYEIIDKKTEEYEGLYVAQSDFGTYLEENKSIIETTARGTIESYDFIGIVDEYMGEDLETIRDYITSINGYIKRGIITDPTTGYECLGIVISEDATFTAETTTVNGREYQRLADGQTVGIYTSTGWQFWMNGARTGWFDSTDGSMHIVNLAIENRLTMNGNWLVSGLSNFSIKWIGG